MVNEVYATNILQMYLVFKKKLYFYSEKNHKIDQKVCYNNVYPEMFLEQNNLHIQIISEGPRDT